MLHLLHQIAIDIQFVAFVQHGLGLGFQDRRRNGRLWASFMASIKSCTAFI